MPAPCNQSARYSSAFVATCSKAVFPAFVFGVFHSSYFSAIIAARRPATILVNVKKVVLLSIFSSIVF